MQVRRRVCGRPSDGQEDTHLPPLFLRERAGRRQLLQACKYANPVARRLYREEAKAIEELRRGIIEASGMKLRYDILIHYVIPNQMQELRQEDIDCGRTATSTLAHDICEALKGQGYNIFIHYVTDSDGWLQSTLTKEGGSAYEIDGEKVQGIYNVLTEHGNRDIDLRLFVPHGELMHT